MSLEGTTNKVFSCNDSNQGLERFRSQSASDRGPYRAGWMEGKLFLHMALDLHGKQEIGRSIHYRQDRQKVRVMQTAIKQH